MRNEEGYRKGIFIEHNTPATRLQARVSFSTSGVAALRRQRAVRPWIRGIFLRCSNGSTLANSLVLVQMPEAQYEQFRDGWKLAATLTAAGAI